MICLICSMTPFYILYKCTNRVKMKKKYQLLKNLLQKTTLVLLKVHDQKLTKGVQHLLHIFAPMQTCSSVDFHKILSPSRTENFVSYFGKTVGKEFDIGSTDTKIIQMNYKDSSDEMRKFICYTVKYSMLFLSTLARLICAFLLVQDHFAFPLQQKRAF